MSIHFGESGPLDETLKQYRVPEHIHDGLIAYVTQGRKPGSFLLAVLSNNLRGSMMHADPETKAALPQIVAWLTWEVNATCWGSFEVVQAWLLKKHEERQGKVK